MGRRHLERVCESVAARQSARGPRSPQRATARGHPGSARESQDSVGHCPQRCGEYRVGSRAAARGLRTRMAARTCTEPLPAAAGIRAQALARGIRSRCQEGFRLGDLPGGTRRSAAARGMDGAAAARRDCLPERGAVGRCRNSRGRIPGGADLGDQLRADLRRALGAAAGKSGVFGLGIGIAHGQSLPRAGAGVSGAACLGLVARRRRKPVRRRIRHRRTIAQHVSRCLRHPEPDTRALPISIQGRGALRRKTADSTHLFRRGERRALQQPLYRAAAAGRARCAAVLLGLSVLCRPAPRLAVPLAAASARRRSRGLRQSTHPARPNRLLFGKIPAPPARLLPDSRQRVLRGRPASTSIPPGPTPMNLTDEILDIFETRGEDVYFGDSISMAEHSLQAAYFAQAQGAPPGLVAPALLHDIGPLVVEVPSDLGDWTEDAHHERVGGRWLAERFRPEVSEPVRLHVPAKRYLLATDAEYFAKLSPASVVTLKLQGGPMAAHEVARFESEPYYKEAVRVRQWDDQGKVAGLKTPQLVDYRVLIEELAIDTARERARR